VVFVWLVVLLVVVSDIGLSRCLSRRGGAWVGVGGGAVAGYVGLGFGWVVLGGGYRVVESVRQLGCCSVLWRSLGMWRSPGRLPHKSVWGGRLCCVCCGRGCGAGGALEEVCRGSCFSDRCSFAGVLGLDLRLDGGTRLFSALFYWLVAFVLCGGLSVVGVFVVVLPLYCLVGFCG